MSNDSSGSWRRTGGIAGIVFGVAYIVLVLILVGSSPTLGDPIADIRDYFTNDANTYFALNWFLALLLIFGFLPFASALRSMLATSDVDAGMWARVSFGGAVATVAVVGVGSLFWSALALNGPEEYSDGAVQALMSLDALTFGAVAPWGFALFLTGASVVILRTGMLWKWLGWLGVVASVLLVIGTWWVVDGDPEGAVATLSLIGVILTFAWSAIAGYGMLSTAGDAS